MNIKKNDNVIIISGKDRGKTGKVTKAIPKASRIVVAGVNVKKIHKRATKSGKKGEIIEQAAPIHVSNALLVDKGGKGTRVRFEMKGDKKIRIAKKSGAEIA